MIAALALLAAATAEPAVGPRLRWGIGVTYEIASVTRDRGLSEGPHAGDCAGPDRDLIKVTSTDINASGAILTWRDVGRLALISPQGIAYGQSDRWQDLSGAPTPYGVYAFKPNEVWHSARYFLVPRDTIFQPGWKIEALSSDKPDWAPLPPVSGEVLTACP